MIPRTPKSTLFPYTTLFRSNPDKPVKQNQKIKEKVFYNTGGQKPFVKRPVITQQRIDEILDKINQKGFNHLSDEEKSILERSEEHTSELQSHVNLVCRLLLE